MDIKEEIRLAREKLLSLCELREKLFKDYILSLFKGTNFVVKNITGHEENYVVEVYKHISNDTGFAFDGRGSKSFYKFNGINRTYGKDMNLSFDDCRFVYEVCEILGWYDDNEYEA